MMVQRSDYRGYYDVMALLPDEVRPKEIRQQKKIITLIGTAVSDLGAYSSVILTKMEKMEKRLMTAFLSNGVLLCLTMVAPLVLPAALLGSSVPFILLGGLAVFGTAMLICYVWREVLKSRIIHQKFGLKIIPAQQAVQGALAEFEAQQRSGESAPQIRMELRLKAELIYAGHRDVRFEQTAYGCGKTVKVPKKDPPTPEEIDRDVEQYIDAYSFMRKTYDNMHHIHGPHFVEMHANTYASFVDILKKAEERRKTIDVEGVAEAGRTTSDIELTPDSFKTRPNSSPSVNPCHRLEGQRRFKIMPLDKD